MSDTSKLLQIQAILDAVPGVVYMTNKPLLFTPQFVSDELKRMLGYEVEEFVGENSIWKSCIDERDLPGLEEQLNSFFESQEHRANFEYRIRLKDGESGKWVRDHVSLIRSEDGELLSLYGVITDISEQKTAEEALLESKEKFETFFNNISNAVFIHPYADKGLMNFVEVNDAACSAYGYSREEFLSLSGSDITISSDSARYGKAAFRKKLFSKEHAIFNAVHVKKNGIKFPVEINSNIIHIKGQPFIMSVVRDLTESIRAQKEIADRNRTIESIYRTAPVGIAIVIDRVIKHVNKSICDLVQYDQDELINKNSRMLYFTDEDYEMVGRETYTFMDEQGIGKVETVFRRKDGKLINVLLRSTLIDSEHYGKGALYSVVDITHLISMQSELESARNKAEESDHLKSAFLANMSHEIRTPMNSIVGFSELLEETDLIPQFRKQYIKQIIKGSNQLLSVINNIMDISKIEAGEVNLNTQRVNLNELIVDLRLSYEIMASDRDLQLLIHPVKTDRSVSLTTDRTKLRQVYENLISNAVKFTQSGYVYFGFVEKEKEIEFYVEDTGVGISQDLADKIFDRFYQEENFLNKTHRGTGLGLAICKKLITLMGGRIWVESEINKGSKFYFTLPINQSTNQSTN